MDIFVSVGCSCDVKYNIDKYIGSKNTLFFLMVDD